MLWLHSTNESCLLWKVCSNEVCTVLVGQLVGKLQLKMSFIYFLYFRDFVSFFLSKSGLVFNSLWGKIKVLGLHSENKSCCLWKVLSKEVCNVLVGQLVGKLQVKLSFKIFFYFCDFVSFFSVMFENLKANVHVANEYGLRSLNK